MHNLRYELHYRGIACIILTQLLGFLFYHEKILGQIWARSWGKTLADLQPTPLHFATSILASLLLFLGMEWLFQNAVLRKGFLFTVSLMVWMFFVAGTLVTHYKFLNLALSTAIIDAIKEFFCIYLTGAIVLLKRESLADSMDRMNPYSRSKVKANR